MITIEDFLYKKLYSKNTSVIKNLERQKKMKYIDVINFFLTNNYDIEKYTLREQFYITFFKIKSHPKCTVCSKKTKYANWTRGFSKTCSRETI